MNLISADCFTATVMVKKYRALQDRSRPHLDCLSAHQKSGIACEKSVSVSPPAHLALSSDASLKSLFTRRSWFAM